jgi:ribosomal protein S12 methylthiotransferase accessory factor YcaO
VAAVTGAEPFAVRLDHHDLGIPAVKVIAPGLQLMDERLLSTVDPMSSLAPLPPSCAEEGTRP